jgi:hypothetical protein
MVQRKEQPEVLNEATTINGLAICGAILLISVLALAISVQSGYHLLKKYDLGAAPGGKEYWDYITFNPLEFSAYNGDHQGVRA